MKKSTITVVLALSIPFSMPAFAGPNWNAIHRAEAHAAHEHGAPEALPVDYGPRALTTPWDNHERMANREATAEMQKKVAASHSGKHSPVVATHAHQHHGSHS